MSNLMISVAGIRGIFGTDLTCEIAIKYARALTRYLGPGAIVVGRDSRVSGPALEKAVVEALCSFGREVKLLGIVPTPTVQLTVEHEHAAGGIAITASHNPQEWNALKLIGPSGRFLTKDQGAEYLAQVEVEESPTTTVTKGKILSMPDAVDKHIGLILKLGIVDVEAVRQKKFRVAVDAVNGAGGMPVRKLLDALGCQATVINEEPTGKFAHNPEPLVENLTSLCALVAGGGFDIGLAVDPDVDRLALVDETGAAMGEECTIALAAQYVLSRSPGSVVTNLSTSAKVEAAAALAGSRVFRTPVGEAHVVEEMEKQKAVIGGEGGGGIILPQCHMGRDSLVGIALIMSLLARSGKKASELAAALPQLTMIKRKLELETAPDLEAVAGPLTEKITGAQIDRRDGIRVTGRQEWVHVRASGTEPIVRIIAESRTGQRTQELVDAAQQAIT